MYDCLIRGGQVFDGAGGAAVVADVAVQGECIAAVGDLRGATARREMDARGRVVCPGFIDVHSHSDAYLLIEPAATSKIFQGITTEVVGNCGASAAPRVGAYQMPADWQEKKYPGTWKTVAEYRRLLEQVQPAVNAVLLIGHKSLRAGVMGMDPRPSTPEEQAAMCQLLEQALDEGGAGLSTGLVYAPGMYAQPEEILALAQVVARRGGLYTSHMRSEGARLLEALRETIAVGRGSGVRLQISHLKTSGRKNWHLLDPALALIRQARAEGVEVAADRYPYTASCTDLDVMLPPWAAGGGRAAVLERLRDLDTRTRIRAQLGREQSRDYWESIMIGATRHPDNRRFQGQRLLEVAADLGLAPVDAALHLMERDELYTGAIFFGMSEENMWRILAESYVMIGTDASIRAPLGPLSKDHPHPRTYGAFPRFWQAAQAGRTVPPAEAIRKMTSLPASQFRLKDRGLLAPRCFADILVLDPAAFQDRATFEQPHQLATGLDAVLVNGIAVIQQGQLTGQRSGRVLTPAP